MKRHIKFISIALATMFTFSGNLVSAYALATSADSSSNFKYGMGNIDSDMEPTLDRDPDKLSSSSYDLPKSVDLSLSDYFPVYEVKDKLVLALLGHQHIINLLMRLLN